MADPETEGFMRRLTQLDTRVKNCIVYLMITMVVFVSALTGEVRLESAHAGLSGEDQAAVVREIPDAIQAEEACTQKMIGAETNLPELRAYRAMGKGLRMFLAEIQIVAGLCTEYSGIGEAEGEADLPIYGRGLVTIIHYIHDLDGKKPL